MVNATCDRLDEFDRFDETVFVYPTADEFYDRLGYLESQIH